MRRSLEALIGLIVMPFLAVGLAVMRFFQFCFARDPEDRHKYDKE